MSLASPGRDIQHHSIMRQGASGPAGVWVTRQPPSGWRGSRGYGAVVRWSALKTSDRSGTPISSGPRAASGEIRPSNSAPAERM